MQGTAPLTQFNTVTLDVNGNGTVALGPTGFGEVWTQIVASVHVSTNTSEATCRIFAGQSNAPQYLSDATTWGSTGDSTSNIPASVPTGQNIYAVWSGGDPGATAYLTLSGVRLVAGAGLDTTAIIKTATGGSFAHDIAGGNGNLIITALQSPNFVHGVSGWQIAKNGNAEFNNVTIRGGAIIGGTSLDYNGTPALGNLVYSQSVSGGTDTFGNVYLAGNVSYQGGLYALQIQGTTLTAYQAAVRGVGPWTPVVASLAFATTLTAPVAIGNNNASPLGDGNFTVFIGPTGDLTGAKDTSAIFQALSSGWTVQLTPGIFYVNAPMSWTNADLIGSGDATVIQPGSGWAGAAILEPGSSAGVRNLSGYGGSVTRSANPAANFIQTAAGAQFWKVEDVTCNYMNGIVIQCAPTTGSHGTIRCIKGEHNAGGIRIDNGTAANVTAEINITDIDLQNCEVSAVFFIQDVTDILMAGPMNGSILAGSGSIGVHVVGSCQTCFLFGLNVGGGNGTAMLQFDSNTNGSPTEIEIGPGTLQQGNIGIAVNAGSRLAFANVWAKSNQGDGWLIAGAAGAGIEMTGCGGNGNNAGAGTSYDVDVTTTSAHVLNQGFRYISTGVTAGRFLVAANHYTEGFPQASLTTAGAVPGGW